MKELTINSWTLSQPEEGAEPLIQDLDLAKRLGYLRPTDVRKLLRRMSSAGQLGERCATVAQRPETGGKEVRAYYLTEAQALKVIARSKTDKADAILDEVIAVYLAWRRGQFVAPSPSPLEAQVAQLAQVVASLVSLVSQSLRPAPLPAQETPRGLPVPSRAPALQRDLLPERAWEWYSVRSLCEQWGLEVGEVWRQFGAAGGRRFVHARQSARGYQIREDVVRKIQIQLEGL